MILFGGPIFGLGLVDCWAGFARFSQAEIMAVTGFKEATAMTDYRFYPCVPLSVSSL